jgi:hypothetical protein
MIKALSTGFIPVLSFTRSVNDFTQISQLEQTINARLFQADLLRANRRCYSVVLVAIVTAESESFILV